MLRLERSKQLNQRLETSGKGSGLLGFRGLGLRVLKKDPIRVIIRGIMGFKVSIIANTILGVAYYKKRIMGPEAPF